MSVGRRSPRLLEFSATIADLARSRLGDVDAGELGGLADERLAQPLGAEAERLVAVHHEREHAGPVLQVHLVAQRVADGDIAAAHDVLADRLLEVVRAEDASPRSSARVGFGRSSSAVPPVLKPQIEILRPQVW